MIMKLAVIALSARNYILLEKVVIEGTAFSDSGEGATIML